MTTQEKLQELFDSFELSKKMKATDYDSLMNIIKDHYTNEMSCKCTAIMKSGEKKGTRCTTNAQKDSQFCKRHEKTVKEDINSTATNECHAKVDGKPCTIVVAAGKPRPDSAKHYYCYRHYSNFQKFE